MCYLIPLQAHSRQPKVLLCCTKQGSVGGDRHSVCHTYYVTTQYLSTDQCTRHSISDAFQVPPSPALLFGRGRWICCTDRGWTILMANFRGAVIMDTPCFCIAYVHSEIRNDGKKKDTAARLTMNAVLNDMVLAFRQKNICQETGQALVPYPFVRWFILVLNRVIKCSTLSAISSSLGNAIVLAFVHESWGHLCDSYVSLTLKNWRSLC